MAAKVRKISETRINKNRYEKNTDKHPTFFSNNNPLSHPSPQSQFSQLSQSSQFSQPLPALPKNIKNVSFPHIHHASIHYFFPLPPENSPLIHSIL